MNLKAKPFYLTDEDIQWIEATKASLTLEEKSLNEAAIKDNPEFLVALGSIKTLKIAGKSVNAPFYAKIKDSLDILGARGCSIHYDAEISIRK